MDDDACCSSLNDPDNTDGLEIDNAGSETEGEPEQPNNNVAVNNQQNARVTVSFMENTISLEFPKFSKGFKESDFREFIRKNVGEENVVSLKQYPEHKNMWMMEVTTTEIKEKLLRIRKTKIKNKTCWINPYHIYEVRGFLHWLPHFISNADVERQLSQFGDVLLIENEVHDYWDVGIKSDVRYFGLRLKMGMVKSDLPHFLKFSGYRTLVIVRGRKPACFHCREFGHSKKDCKIFEAKLKGYCNNSETKKPRKKPRGRRYRPDSDAKYEGEDNKHGKETNSTSTSTSPTQKDSELIKSYLKRSHSDTLKADEKKAEILAILHSLKEWKKETTEMVEETFKNMEESFRMNLIPSELTESEEKEESIKFANEIIAKLLDEMKEVTNEMIEQTLNNLKNIVADFFGLDSKESLETLISYFKTSKEKLGSKEVKFVEGGFLCSVPFEKD